jgi:tRNA-specific 2-thiouridylase
LKFDQLITVARQIGADKVATGHYARNEYDAKRGRWILKRPADASKDQTYFLFGLTQEQLSRTVFPLGEMRKPEVRESARQHGLNVLADKPDSQEICFVPGGDYKQFIDAYLSEQGEQLPDTSGEMVTSSGEVVGKHAGIHNFTVGQRKGLNVATQNPLYVLEIRGDKKQVVVGSNDELLSKTMIVKKLNWISIPELSAPMRVKVKIRHRHEPAAATIEMQGSDVLATFDEPQRAVTPGQAAVFYDGDEVVGGGWIA